MNDIADQLPERLRTVAALLNTYCAQQAEAVRADPVDVVQITQGFLLAFWPAGGLTIEASEVLADAALGLADAWREWGKDYDGVWAYDIAYAVGFQLGTRYGIDTPESPREWARRYARWLAGE